MANEEKNDNIDSQLHVPEWINAALIQRALENSGEVKLQVQNISVAMATAPGENYASSIYRVQATLSNSSVRSFLVKCPLANQTLSQTPGQISPFKREGIMLGKVVPQIEALLEEAAPGRFPPLAARCPLYGSDPVEFLVLEDLAPAGFKMAARRCGLDFHHSLLALQNLARYHAGTHAFLRKKPEIAKTLKHQWLVVNEAMCAAAENTVMMAAVSCLSWPGYEEYGTLLEKFTSVVVRSFMKVLITKPEDFTAILHSDFWLNNMLFQHEDGYLQPQGYRLVDFQNSSVGSPTLDLHYFFSTSVSEDVSAHHEEELLREYHNTLVETLRLLKLEAPSFDALMKDMDERGAFALIGMISALPLVRSERPEDLEKSLDEGASSTLSKFDEPAVKKWMQRVLPEYKRRRWLPS